MAAQFWANIWPGNFLFADLYQRGLSWVSLCCTVFSSLKPQTFIISQDYSDHMCGSSELQAVPAPAGRSHTCAHGGDGGDGWVHLGSLAWLDPLSCGLSLSRRLALIASIFQCPIGQSKSHSTGDWKWQPYFAASPIQHLFPHHMNLGCPWYLLWEIKYGRNNNVLLGILGTKMPWAHKPFCVPHFSITGNRLHLPSWRFPEFQQSGSNRC